MIIHLWGKYFMAAWRGGRAMTWMTGVVTFLASIVTAFTGYASQSNFDSQWITTQAKDGINATGGGAFFNVLNFGQMLMWHIVILPLAAVLLTVLHIAMVRVKGVVPPFEEK
jgi:ubiquinol-cytochrome c reductase cytochrome b subunit